MALTYHFFRHVRAPKERQLQNNPDYDFRRAVDSVGIKQGLALGKRLKRDGIKPILVLHSEAPRAIITANLACPDFRIPFIPLKEFWPRDRVFFKRMWDICCRYQFNIYSYLENPDELAIYTEYGKRIWNEIEKNVEKHSKAETGDILIFGHGVWNCFVAWAAAGCPNHMRPFLRRLKECDGLVVNERTVRYVPFQ